MTQPSYSSPMPYPAPGEVLDGKYQIDRLLGEGGMGAVARAMHLLRRAPVALKFMSPAIMSLPGAIDRFINEGVAASQIDSDHVVKIFDVGRLPTGVPYLVMEYLEGEDLSALLAREGKPGLDIERSVHFTLQTLRGLQVAHAASVVHRDMKPSNCFVIQKDGEPDFIKLVDFGISKVQQPGGVNITRTNSALGTPLYMSPEQARAPRDVDLRSDLYSVGVILYELLTGRTPFHSDTGEFTEILFKIFTMEPPHIKQFRADLPDGLCAAIHRALARDPAARYSSAAEMGDALVPWADHRSQQTVLRMRAHALGRQSKTPSVAPPGGNAGSIPPLASPASQVQAATPARTGVGVVRDAAQSQSGTLRKTIWTYIALPIAAIGMLIAIGVVVVRMQMTKRNVAPPTASASAGQPPADSATLGNLAPPAIPSSSALPQNPTVTIPIEQPSTDVVPTASASASAHAPKRPIPPARPTPPPDHPQTRPSELIDVKPKQ